ncbi:hypothetical protein SODALDRAFT_328325 [Sodiomyces alkalinus F11]|uniref:Uncharacterized protein n=1 Tax=Sodiomyces alkalinus (strain CBS 110278 / VKM F-3762 / F11) TaxID=1314773 RepID=A0A3N2PN72_SODAK|nr:hypothetical protein SODALDRAFT_328325 [Sodiomyces alkalinus F11]ROT35939.1 hypothetical protein SODALDRAFT_328325 [Sodiomyces alkalinus F11]
MSADGHSESVAMEKLHVQSALAVHHFLATNGVSYPPHFKVQSVGGLDDDDDDDDDDDAGDGCSSGDNRGRAQSLTALGASELVSLCDSGSEASDDQVMQMRRRRPKRRTSATILLSSQSRGGLKRQGQRQERRRPVRVRIHTTSSEDSDNDDGDETRSPPSPKIKPKVVIPTEFAEPSAPPTFTVLLLSGPSDSVSPASFPPPPPAPAPAPPSSRPCSNFHARVRLLSSNLSHGVEQRHGDDFVTTLPLPTLRSLLDAVAAHVYASARASSNGSRPSARVTIRVRLRRARVEGVMCDLSGFRSDDLGVVFEGAAREKGLPFFEVEAETMQPAS